MVLRPVPTEQPRNDEPAPQSSSGPNSNANPSNGAHVFVSGASFEMPPQFGALLGSLMQGAANANNSSAPSPGMNSNASQSNNENNNGARPSRPAIVPVNLSLDAIRRRVSESAEQLELRMY